MFLRSNGPILIVGAHPDDCELMAGGLIHRAVSDGVDVYSAVMSDGTENGRMITRQQEVERASKILGIKKVFFCGLKDGMILHNIDTVKIIDNFIKDIQPGIIITHSMDDTHQDHKNVCNITLSSVRRRQNIVLMGETPTSYFNDNLVYFDITNTMEMKMKALRVYLSQIRDGPIRLKNVRTLARYRGQKIGTKYAEAFKNWRMLL